MSEPETPDTAAETPAPAEEKKRLYESTHMHGVKHEGKRIRAGQRFEAFPWQVKQDLAKGFVEDVLEAEAQQKERAATEAKIAADLAASERETTEVQTSALVTETATGHSEDEEGR